MKWHWKTMGGHTHVRVFMNGTKCGDLCFRNEEFEQVQSSCPWITYIEDAAQSLPPWACSACGQNNSGWEIECRRCGKANPRRAA